RDPGSRRSGDQDRAVRATVRALEPFLGFGQEPELLEAQHGLALVEDSHDDLFAVHRRQRRDAEVDAAATHLHADAAVLRDAALGDVDVGHDLQTADDARLDAAGRAHHFVEHAVDAETDPEVVFG